MDKEEEISCLRDHNPKLLLQVKKVKDRVHHHQKIEEENRALQKKLVEFNDNVNLQEE